MSDPTLAVCDDEPWNQPGECPAATLPKLPARGAHKKRRSGPKDVAELSVYERVMRRIPIYSAPGINAGYVYSVSGVSTAQESCLDCADMAILAAWQEYEWCAKERRYLPRRCVDLCEACGLALESLPLGEKWQRSRKKAAVLARCIRSLEAVGHTEAAAALRVLLAPEKQKPRA